MKIKAAILRQCGLPLPYRDSKPLSIETVDLDPPGPYEVLVEIKAAGLCHSDLVAIDGERAKPMPIVLGHEAVGIIAKCGPGVNRFAVGDVVVPAFVASCGKCEMCVTGRPALCLPASKANAEGVLLGGHTRVSQNGQRIFHHSGVAAFAEFAVISEHSLVKIEHDIPFEHAALFGCGVMTGVGAVLNTSPLKVDDTVAVVGLGGVGLSAVMAAHAGGAARVIGIDVNPSKLESALKFGATEVFDASDDDVVAKVKQATGGGVDIAVEAAGVPQALELAFAVTAIGGSTVAAGLPNPKREISLSHFTLVAHERKLLGSYMGSCIPSRDIPRFINMCTHGKLAIDKLASNTVCLEELNEAFDLMVEGSMLRNVLVL
ncbi:zinc-binding dehydrogenase [Alphaproteobacteria bacterium]|nr:zinc-binding dehydrogenase [Alphaproteobacteria bacterium]